MDTPYDDDVDLDTLAMWDALRAIADHFTRLAEHGPSWIARDVARLRDIAETIEDQHLEGLEEYN